MSHAAGRVWVGPGVEKTAGDVADGVAGTEVITIVGVGVTALFSDCVHPAARASTAQSTSAEVITMIFFISDN